MRWIKRLGLMTVGMVLAVVLLAAWELSAFFSPDYDPRDTKAARAALTDVGLSAFLSQAEESLHFDSHGGFHGDGCTVTIFETTPGALWEPINHGASGWTVEPVDHQAYAEMIPRCSCHPDVFPAPDVVFDAWYYRVDDYGAEDRPFNYSKAFYDAQTGLFYFFRVDI